MGSNSKKMKYKNVTKGHPKPSLGLMSNSNTYDLRGNTDSSTNYKLKKADYSNYICSDISKKAASRTAGLNKSDLRPSTTKKRRVSAIKLTSGDSRNKSIASKGIQDSKENVMDSGTEYTNKQSSKSTNKYRKLSFYNNQFKDKKSVNQSYMIPGMVSRYANNIITNPVPLQKHVKNAKLVKDSSIFDDTRTRNQQPGIYKTNETVPYQLTNESYLQMKSTDNKKLKRIKKKRSSASNSHSKSKHTKSTTEYIAKPKEKVSSRTSSTIGKGPMYHTFYQKESKVSFDYNLGSELILETLGCKQRIRQLLNAT